MEKQFLDYLENSLNDRFRCEFETHKGKVTQISVVQYETRLRGRWVPVVRYDTAHGFFHRDIYFSRGRRRFKEIVHHPSLEEALTSAIRDLRQNWRKYKTAFLGEGNGEENV